MAAAPLVTLKRRSEFLRVRGGRRWHTPAFLIEMRPIVETAEGPAIAAPRAPASANTAFSRSPRPAGGSPARFGFTVTKKLGPAVVRNRIRRRLKAAVQSLLAEYAKPGCDYVIVARREAETRPFAALCEDLMVAFVRLHAQKSARQSHRSPDTRRSS